MKQILAKVITMALAGAFVIGAHVPEGAAPSSSWGAHIKRFYDRVQADKKSDRIPGNWYFYMQRAYGNPGINVDRMLYEAAWHVAAMQQSASRNGFPKSAAEETPWYPLGPVNVGGRMRSIAFHPADENIVYAGAASGGVFKMTDGFTWEPVMDFAPALAVGALALDPNNPDIVFAGTGEPVAQTPLSFSSPSFYGVGVMKSTDAGGTWELLPWINSSVAIQQIIVSPVSNDTLLVATTRGLHKTRNSGANWTLVLEGNITDMEAKPGNPNVIYAAIGEDMGSPANGVYRSEANGDDTTWVKLSNNFPPGTDFGRLLLGTTPADPDLLMAILSKPMGPTFPVSDDFYGILKSTDAGETWEQLEVSGIDSVRFGNGQLFYDFCFAISPTNKNRMYAGGIELWYSSNGGAFWQKSAGAGQVHVDHHFVAFQERTSEPGKYWLWNGNDGGIYQNQNPEIGNLWINKEATLVTAQYYTLAIDSAYTWRIYGGTQDNGTHKLTSRATGIWDDNVNGGDGGYVMVARENSNIFFTNVTVHKGPYRTVNNGGRHTLLTEGLGGTDPNEFFSWITTMTLVYPSTANNVSQLYVGSQYMYMANNATHPTVTPTFQLLSQTRLVRRSQADMQYESVITAMAVAPSAPNYMYVGSGDGGLFRTRNLQAGPGLAGFENITIQGKAPRWVTRLAVDPRNEHYVYATFSGYRSGHVWRSTDDGTSWTNISSNLPDIPVNSIKIHPVYSNVLFIATDAGVWFSTNTGAEWQILGTGHPNVVVSDIDFLTDDGLYLISASFGRGMWYAKLPDFTVGTDNVPLPNALSLSAAWPQPLRAGGQATVEFTVPQAQHTTITLYDLQGRPVRTLYDGVSRPGTTLVRLSAAGLSPGMYFYRLNAGGQALTRKIIIES